MSRPLVSVPVTTDEPGVDGDGSRRHAADAFEREVLPHSQALYRQALRLTRDEQAAEDLVQDTLERALRNFGRFQPGTNLRAWLFRIMTNLRISSYRHQSAAPRIAPLDEVERRPLGRQVNGAVASASEVERVAIERIGEASILAAIDELPPKFRTVVRLSDVEGFAYRGIADVLQVPIGTVTSRLFRGRRQLQRALGDQAREAGCLARAS